MDDPVQKPENRDDDKGDKAAAGGLDAKLDQILSRHELRLIEAGLPMVPDGKPIPNHVLRSALFGVTAKAFRREQEVAAVDGIHVYIARGYRPTQAHLDVWEHCLVLASKHGTGKEIRFSAYSFLKAIGRNPNGGSERKWLYDPDGHPKLPHLWPVKLLQAGRSNYEASGLMAMRAAASLRR